MKKSLSLVILLACAMTLTWCATAIPQKNTTTGAVSSTTGVVLPTTGTNASTMRTTNSGRLTYNGLGFQFQYPKNFSGNVRHPITWPPVLHVVSLTQDPVAIGCPDMKDTIEQSWTIQGKTNDGLTYLLYKWGDAGAGQRYSLYCYAVQGKNNYYVFDITIRSANGCGWGSCGAYCGTPFEQECRNLDRVKDIEQPLNNIVATLKVKETAPVYIKHENWQNSNLLASCVQNSDCRLVDLKRICPVIESINIHNSTTEIRNFITEEQTLIGSGRMLVRCVAPKKIGDYHPICKENVCDIEKK